MNKKKVLIYIDSDVYVRNHFTENTFDLKNYEKVIYANENILKKYILEKYDEFKGYVKTTEKYQKILKLRKYLVNKKHFNKSKSFKFKYYHNWNKKGIKFKIRDKIFGFMTFKPIYKSVLFFVDKFIGHNKEMKKILEEEKPDLVMMPFKDISLIQEDIIKLCKKKNIKTLSLIDGWDNVSSKTIFLEKTDFIAVWGEQSVKHAIDIHDYKKEQIFKIGTPRFDFYYFYKHNMDNPIFNFKYVIFTGCYVPYDEITPLKILDQYLIDNNIKDIKIIYRPHPFRAPRDCFDYFIEEDFENVLLDKQIKGYYYFLKNNYVKKYEDAASPSLKYYPRLLKDSLFVISPLTTMIIEAAIMKKRVLTIAYDDKIHYTNPKDVLENYEHFEGIENIKSFEMCYDIKNLTTKFEEMLNNENAESDFDEDLKYIIERPEKKYSERLEDLIDKIFN